MKRNSFVLALALALTLVTAAGQAQVGFNFGPRVGLNFSSLTLSSTSGLSVDGRIGYTLGAFARVDISKFTIQPELAYSVRRGKLTQSSIEGEIETRTFDIPLLFGYKFVDAKIVKARILAGPVFTFKSGADFPSLGTLLDYPSNYITSWQAGVAVDVWKLLFDLRYEGAFKAQVQDATGTNTVRLNQFQLGIAYKIL